LALQLRREDLHVNDIDQHSSSQESGLEEITTAELLEAAISHREIDVHTALPARVESFNASAQTVNVTIMCNRAVPDGNGNYISEQLPALADVPVAFPRSGAFFISFPLAAGDFGFLVFAERNISAYRATGAQGDPGDLGMHTLDGAVFFPCVYPDAKALSNVDATNMVLGSDTSAASRIVIKPSGEVDIGATATNFVAMADKVKTWLDAFVAAVNGWVPVSMDGGAALKTALATILAGTPTTNVASSNLKAED
jgi:hypothetical protein